jgi:hypothetical protein
MHSTPERIGQKAIYIFAESSRNLQIKLAFTAAEGSVPSLCTGVSQLRESAGSDGV